MTVLLRRSFQLYISISSLYDCINHTKLVFYLHRIFVVRESLYLYDILIVADRRLYIIYIYIYITPFTISIFVHWRDFQTLFNRKKCEVWLRSTEKPI